MYMHIKILYYCCFSPTFQRIWCHIDKLKGHLGFGYHLFCEIGFWVPKFMKIGFWVPFSIFLLVNVGWLLPPLICAQTTLVYTKPSINTLPIITTWVSTNRTHPGRKGDSSAAYNLLIAVISPTYNIFIFLFIIHSWVNQNW